MNLIIVWKSRLGWLFIYTNLIKDFLDYPGVHESSRIFLHLIKFKTYGFNKAHH